MTVLENQYDFETPTSLIPKGYAAIGALGDEVLEEAAMRILFFSRERGEYVSVSKREIELRWGRADDEPSLCKAVGGLPCLFQFIQILIDSDAVEVVGNGEYAPTPKLVSAVYQASLKNRRRLVCTK